MNANVEITGTDKLARTGVHRFFHTSKLDFPICGALAIALFTFAGFEALGPEQLHAALSAVDATQIGLLLLILGTLLDAHYRMFEVKYDK